MSAALVKLLRDTANKVELANLDGSRSAWLAVADTMSAHNPDWCRRKQGASGIECAVDELNRLYAIEKGLKDMLK